MNGVAESPSKKKEVDPRIPFILVVDDNGFNVKVARDMLASLKIRTE